MILRCPNCKSPVDAPDEDGELVTCGYCDTVARTSKQELVALRAWDAAAPGQWAAPPAAPPPPPPTSQEPQESHPMRLDKRAWKSPSTPVAAPLFPPTDLEAAAKAMSPHPEGMAPEPPPVPVAQQVRPLLKIGLPVMAGAAVLAAAIFAWVKFSSEEESGEGDARPPAIAPKGPTLDPDAERKAELAKAVEAAARRLDQKYAFEPADVPALVVLLARPDLRLLAIEALAKIGEPAAVPALLALLDDPLAGPAALDAASRITPRSSTLRDALEKTLGAAVPTPSSLAAIVACERLGPDGAIPLGAGLRSPSKEVRDLCVQALVKIGSPALFVVLSNLRRAGNPDAQEAATAVLLGLQTVPISEAPTLLAEIGAHPPADRAIFALLRRLGPNVLPRMLEALDAREGKEGEEWWEAARECVESLGGGAVPVVQSWLEEHRIERPRVRALLARSAGAWGRDAVPLLVTALTDDDSGVRNAAVESLGHIGPGAGRAWEALQSGATSGNFDHRVAAVAVRIRGAGAVPLLVQLLTAVDAPTRLAAAKELGALGAAAAPAVPDLITALSDANLRPAALTALENIGDPAVEALVAALGHDLPEVRMGAAVALGKLGPRTVAIAPALFQALTDEVKEVSDASLRALLAMGPDGVHQFEKALKHKNRSLRAVAVWALGKMGPAAAGALPELRAALEHGEDPYRESIVKTIGRLGPKAVADLSELLKHDHAGIREWSAEALGGMGAEGAAALPALKEAMEDREPAVKAAAAAAVEKLEKK